VSYRYKGGAGRAGGRVCAGVVVVVAVQEVVGRGWRRVGVRKKVGVAGKYLEKY
jgi:hypothetical protein